MTHRQIQCFLEVGKEMSFSRAAENLFLPQPAVTKHVAALERELETKLFTRDSSHKIYFTKDGMVYYNMFERFALEFKNTRQLLQLPLNTLRFGYNDGWNISSFLPKIVQECKIHYPDFLIEIECRGLNDLYTAFINHELDVIMTFYDMIENTPAIECDIVAVIKRLIIYSDLLLPDQLIQTPADFYACDFLLEKDANIPHIRNRIISMLEEYRFVPKFKTELNMQTVIANVENGIGVALLDEWAQALTNEAIHSIDLNAHHRVCLAWHKSMESSSLQVFRNNFKINHCAD